MPPPLGPKALLALAVEPPQKASIDAAEVSSGVSTGNAVDVDTALEIGGRTSAISQPGWESLPSILDEEREVDSGDAADQAGKGKFRLRISSALTAALLGG
jgi:hypothetical protein